MKSFYYYVFVVALLILVVPSVSQAAQNTTGYAWGENIGWLNMSTSSPATWGVNVADTELTGYMYGENIGWISLNCNQPVSSTNTCGTNPYHVNNVQGKLSGYAWGENVGWIDFGAAGARTWGVTIGTTTNVGEFLGYAYGENVGWISFNCLNGTNTCGTNNYKATTSWRVTGGSTYSISGTVKYYDGVKNVSGATITLRNAAGSVVSTYTSDANGGYLFTNIPGGVNYTIGVGKADISSSISANDLVKISQHIAGSNTGNSSKLLDSVYKIISADGNNVPPITSNDLLKITRFKTSYSNNPLITGAWKFYPATVLASLTSSNHNTIGTTTLITNLSSNQTSKDFTGIKMGDVNNSWPN